jgi:hypothetical protein
MLAERAEGREAPTTSLEAFSRPSVAPQAGAYHATENGSRAALFTVGGKATLDAPERARDAGPVRTGGWREGPWRRSIGARVASGAVFLVLAIPFVALVASAQVPAPPAPPAPATPAAPSSPLTDRGRQGRVVPPALEDIEQVCALLTSCDRLPIPPSMVPTDFAACVRSIDAQLASPSAVAFSLLVRECGLTANSCAELRTCGLRGASPTGCTGRGKDNAAGYCDIDGRALSCWHERVAGVRDCPRGGEQCSVREGQSACSLGPCPAGMAEGAAPVCSGSGTRILKCEHGVLTSLDCAAFGLICSNGSDGAACASPTAPCTGATRRCDGDTAVSCYDGHEVRVECATAGMSCNPVDQGARAVGACTAPAPASGTCDANGRARCEGATLHYCAAGRPRSFLCKALGFNRCVADANGAHCG